jgi:hypothetical protein
MKVFPPDGGGQEVKGILSEVETTIVTTAKPAHPGRASVLSRNRFRHEHPVDAICNMQFAICKVRGEW